MLFRSHHPLRLFPERTGHANRSIDTERFYRIVNLHYRRWRRAERRCLEVQFPQFVQPRWDR